CLSPLSQNACVGLAAGLDFEDPKVKPSSSANAIYSLASRPFQVPKAPSGDHSDSGDDSEYRFPSSRPVTSTVLPKSEASRPPEAVPSMRPAEQQMELESYETMYDIHLQATQLPLGPAREE
ncbi:hypothetical protein FKM82_030459, partial [Ascaphus truei]